MKLHYMIIHGFTSLKRNVFNEWTYHSIVSAKRNVKYHELSVLSNSWTQSYSFLIYLNKNIEYWVKHWLLRARFYKYLQRSYQFQWCILETIYFSSNWRLFHAKISTTGLTVRDWLHQVLLCLPSNCPGFIKCLVISDRWLDDPSNQRWAENPDWMSGSKFVYWSRGQNQNK